LRALGFLGLALLRIELFLLRPAPGFEHIALDVGALAPHLDIDGTGGGPDCRPVFNFALVLPLESDAARR